MSDATELVMPSGATEVLPVDAPRLLWLAERRRSIGGSDVSVLAGLSDYGSLVSLWLDKTGRLDDQPASDAMQWGTRLEPVVREWFAETYRLDIRRAGLHRRADLPHLHCNPDGVVVDRGRPTAGLEVKCLSWRQAHLWADGQTPDHAELQAQLGMHVTGLDAWHVVGLVDGRDPQVRTVHRDDDLCSMLTGLAEDFWRDHVEPDVAPPLDGSAATNAAVRAWLAEPATGLAVAMTPSLAAAFRAQADAAAAVASAKAAERAADSALRVALGDAEIVVDDPELPVDKRTVYATYTRDGTFADRRFAAAEPGLAAEFVRQVDRTDTAALKASCPEMHRRYCARVLRWRRPLHALITQET